jgi:tetratricopeptide (TPR) repeat protein
MSVRDTTLPAADFIQAENGIAQFVRWLRVICFTFISGRSGKFPLVQRAHLHPRSLQKIAREEIIRSQIARLYGNLGRSAWHLRRALEICPDYVDALIRLGAYWRERGQYELASHYFRKAMTLDPSFARWRPGIDRNSHN